MSLMCYTAVGSRSPGVRPGQNGINRPDQVVAGRVQVEGRHRHLAALAHFRREAFPCEDFDARRCLNKAAVGGSGGVGNDDGRVLLHSVYDAAQPGAYHVNRGLSQQMPVPVRLLSLLTQADSVKLETFLPIGGPRSKKLPKRAASTGDADAGRAAPNFPSG